MPGVDDDVGQFEVGGVDDRYDVWRALRELLPGLAALDVKGFGEDKLRALLSDVRATQRLLDGVVIQIGVESNGLAARGAGSCAEEALRAGGEVSARQAQREAARAAAVEQIRGLGAAVSTGATTGEHIDSVARHIAKLSDEQRAGFDFDAVVERASQMLPETFDRFVKRSVDTAMNDHGLSDTKTKQAASEFRHWFDQSSGMGRFSGSLDPERYEMLVNAIDRRVASIAAAAGNTVTKNKNLAAQALVDMVTEPRHVGDGAGRRIASVLVVVDQQTVDKGVHGGSIRQTENGHDVAGESIARLCCDAVIRRVTVDHTGVPINVGRKYRTATDAQWAAIKGVHADCAWAGCAAPISWCQAHHIHEWERGGSTNLDNLVPLCSKHHHRVHEGKWSIKLLPDRSLEIYKPDGSHHVTVPTPRRC